jgi:hypothetical protein
LPPEKAAPQMLHGTQAHFTRLMLGGVVTYIPSDRQMTIRSSGGVGKRTLERVVFDEILVNPELSKADFRIDRK